MKEPRELSLLHRFSLSGFAVLNESNAGTTQGDRYGASKTTSILGQVREKIADAGKSHIYKTKDEKEVHKG